MVGWKHFCVGTQPWDVDNARIQKQALAYQSHVLKNTLKIKYKLKCVHVFFTSFRVLFIALQIVPTFFNTELLKANIFSKELLKLAIYLTVFKRLFSHTSKLLNFNTANSLFFLCQNLSNLKHTHFMMYSEMKDLAHRLLNSSNGNTQSKYFRLV